MGTFQDLVAVLVGSGRSGEAMDEFGGAGRLRLGSLDKVFGSGIRAAGAIESRGKRTDRDLDYGVGFIELMSWFVGQEGGHNSAPDGGGAGDARGDPGHGRIVVVTDPDRHQVFVGVTKGPVVP